MEITDKIFSFFKILSLILIGTWLTISNSKNFYVSGVEISISSIMIKYLGFLFLQLILKTVIPGRSVNGIRMNSLLLNIINIVLIIVPILSLNIPIEYIFNYLPILTIIYSILVLTLSMFIKMTSLTTNKFDNWLKHYMYFNISIPVSIVLLLSSIIRQYKHNLIIDYQLSSMIVLLLFYLFNNLKDEEKYCERYLYPQKLDAFFVIEYMFWLPLIYVNHINWYIGQRHIISVNKQLITMILLLGTFLINFKSQLEYNITDNLSIIYNTKMIGFLNIIISFVMLIPVFYSDIYYVFFIYTIFRMIENYM